jgi:hypothetical protein
MALSVDGDGMCGAMSEQSESRPVKRTLDIESASHQKGSALPHSNCGHMSGLQIAEAQERLFLIRYVIYHAASTPI